MIFPRLKYMPFIHFFKLEWILLSALFSVVELYLFLSYQFYNTAYFSLSDNILLCKKGEQLYYADQLPVNNVPQVVLK